MLEKGVVWVSEHVEGESQSNNTEDVKAASGGSSGTEKYSPGSNGWSSRSTWSVRRHRAVPGSVRKGSSRVTKSMDCVLKRLRCIDELESTRPGERCRARVVH